MNERMERLDARILLVDDSRTDLLLMQSVLSDCETRSARNGAEALEQLEREPGIEMMLLDLDMPIMDGYAVLAALRDDPDRYGDITVLILTHLSEPENEIRGLDLGAVDFIHKPLHAESLRRRIGSTSSRAAAARSVHAAPSCWPPGCRRHLKKG